MKSGRAKPHALPYAVTPSVHYRAITQCGARMDLEPPPDQPPPLLHGPREVVEGYYDLEALERNQRYQTLTMHPDAVALWYRALTLHQRALLLEGDFGAEPGTPEGTAQRLQMQLLCLSISSSKAALDMLLA